MSEGVVVVGFTNYRDARHAYMNIEVQNPSWQLNRLSPKSWACYGAAPTSSQTNVALVSDFEGQVILSVYFNGRDSSIKARPTVEFIKQTLAKHGHVKAFHTLAYRQNNVREIRVEYYDVLAAEKASGLLNNAQFDVRTTTTSCEHAADTVSTATCLHRRALQAGCSTCHPHPRWSGHATLIHWPLSGPN